MENLIAEALGFSLTENGIKVWPTKLYPGRLLYSVICGGNNPEGCATAVHCETPLTLHTTGSDLHLLAGTCWRCGRIHLVRVNVEPDLHY